MSRRIPFAFATLSLVLGGCAIGPDYLRPEQPLPKQFNETASSTQEAATVNARWWTLFNDATLNALVERGLQGNADLRLAVARVEQAEALSREAGATLFPARAIWTVFGSSRPSASRSIR